MTRKVSPPPRRSHGRWRWVLTLGVTVAAGIFIVNLAGTPQHVTPETLYPGTAIVHGDGSYGTYLQTVDAKDPDVVKFDPISNLVVKGGQLYVRKVPTDDACATKCAVGTISGGEAKVALPPDYLWYGNIQPEPTDVVPVTSLTYWAGPQFAGLQVTRAASLSVPMPMALERVKTDDLTNGEVAFVSQSGLRRTPDGNGMAVAGSWAAWEQAAGPTFTITPVYRATVQSDGSLEVCLPADTYIADQRPGESGRTVHFVSNC